MVELYICIYTSMNMNTPDHIKQLFDLNGQSIARWSRDHGFPPALVYRVLRGDTTAKRGKTHEIAVALGIKRAPDVEEQSLFAVLN